MSAPALLRAALALACAAPAPASEAAELLARVDGRPIPAALHSWFLANGAEALGLDTAAREGREALARLERAVAEELVDRALIAAEADRRGIAPAEADVEARLRQAAAETGGTQRFHAGLAAHGLGEAELREALRQELAGPLVQAALAADVRVSRDEARAFHEEHGADPGLRGLFVQPETVVASHVLLEARPRVIERRLAREQGLAGEALQRAVAEAMAQRRGQAEQIRRRAEAGADFAALARERSDDAASAKQGGRLGRFARGAHTAAFDDAAFALAPGAIGLVETEFGFHVVAVEAREPERARSFEEVRPAIEERLLARKRSARLRGWLEARRAQARIERNPGRFPSLAGAAAAPAARSEEEP